MTPKRWKTRQFHDLQFNNDGGDARSEHYNSEVRWVMAIYDLYEINAGTISEARDIVERSLSILFSERDSSFHRGPYFSAGRIGGENFEIKFNMDPYEDEPTEDKFPDASYLLYVNNTDRSEELKNLLTSNAAVHLLRHDDIVK